MVPFISPDFCYIFEISSRSQFNRGDWHFLCDGQRFINTVSCQEYYILGGLTNFLELISLS